MMRTEGKPKQERTEGKGGKMGGIFALAWENFG
jgi:hypothetical protein